MNFNEQDQSGVVTLSAAKGFSRYGASRLPEASHPRCHPERSEGSLSLGTEMLRGVYPERSEGLSMTLLVLVVKFHNRGSPIYRGIQRQL
jgi:hypothetical protein